MSKRQLCEVVIDDQIFAVFEPAWLPPVGSRIAFADKDDRDKVATYKVTDIVTIALDWITAERSVGLNDELMDEFGTLLAPLKSKVRLYVIKDANLLTEVIALDSE